MSTLVLEALDVRFGGVQAVRGLSFEVAPGEIVGLIGANGAGKSSTLHAIMGVAPVVGGDVRLGDVSLRNRRPEDNRLLYFHARPLAVHKSDLPVYGKGTRDKDQRNGKLEEDKSFAQPGAIL